MKFRDFIQKTFLPVSCIRLMFLCNMPVYAADEEDINVLDDTQSSSTVEHNIIVDWPNNPIAVYQVDNPYRIEPLATLGDVYQGSISDAIRNYLLGFVQPFDDYLIYRSGQYTYVVITGNDFESSNNRVSGTGLVTTFTNGTGNNATYTLNQSERTFSVNTGGSAYVYSNLDGYSDSLKEVRYEAFTSYSTVIVFVFIAVRDLFKSIFR